MHNVFSLLQGDPLATRITVRIVSILGLTVAEQKEAMLNLQEEDGGSGGLLEQKDGIAIEINNPLRPVCIELSRLEFCHIPESCNTCAA